MLVNMWIVTRPEITALCCVFDAPLDDDQAGELAVQLKAMADPVRLRILSIIATASSGEVCACVFPDALGRSQPTVSHHLHQLTSVGLIAREQRGKWAWFRLAPERLASVRAALGEGAQRRRVTQAHVTR